MLNQEPFIALMAIMKIIDAREADLLARELPPMGVPKNWFGIIQQFELIIGRKLL